MEGNEGSDALGFESDLWASANKLRGSMDAAEYKHVVLPLVFLKYISDAFEDTHARLTEEGRNPEIRDEYTARGIFWVPEEARWTGIVERADSKPNASEPSLLSITITLAQNDCNTYIQSI